MANIDAPRGFKLRHDLMGYMPALERCVILSGDGTKTYIGDAVKVAGSSDTNGFAKSIIRAAATDPIYGVVMGFDQVDGISDANFSLYRKHRPASVQMYALVCNDPNALYEIQVDDDSAAFAATDVGLNADILATAGNDTTGYSAMELDASTLLDTATLQLKVMAVVPRNDNELGDFCKVIVKINNHQLGSHTGTAGV